MQAAMRPWFEQAPWLAVLLLQSGNSGNTVRCPSGTCYGSGQAGCTASCGGKDCCPAVSVDCGKGRMDGRTCSNKCEEADPYYATRISRAGAYPTCPKGDGDDPE